MQTTSPPRVQRSTNWSTSSCRSSATCPACRVNSLHHQAVKTVPAGMQVMALSQDGLIESIWRPGVLGVQFHPELLVETDRTWERLFRWFTFDSSGLGRGGRTAAAG